MQTTTAATLPADIAASLARSFQSVAMAQAHLTHTLDLCKEHKVLRHQFHIIDTLKDGIRKTNSVNDNLRMKIGNAGRELLNELKADPAGLENVRLAFYEGTQEFRDFIEHACTFPLHYLEAWVAAKERNTGTT